MWINKDYFTQCEVVFSFLKKYNYEKDVTRKKDIGSDVSENFSIRAQSLRKSQESAS